MTSGIRFGASPPRTHNSQYGLDPTSGENYCLKRKHRPMVQLSPMLGQLPIIRLLPPVARLRLSQAGADRTLTSFIWPTGRPIYSRVALSKARQATIGKSSRDNRRRFTSPD